MKGIGKQILFWNWKSEASNVLMRYDNDCITFFKKSGSLVDLMSSKEKNIFVDIVGN